MKNKFIKRLDSKKPLLWDGAMGTLLMKLGADPHTCLELENINNPGLVSQVHREYLEAGVDIIETNTFGANRFKLSHYDLADKVTEINFKAAQNARKVVLTKGLVAGSVGPTGKLMQPSGELSFDEAYKIFSEQVVALEKGGVDLITIETMTDILELRAAIIAVRQNTKLPVVCHLTFEENGRTVSGTDIKVLVGVAESLGVSALGLNCSTGPQGMSKIVNDLLQFSSLPISVLPNAGLPEIIEGEVSYRLGPADFAAYAIDFLKRGVSLLGGCCGTTPAHLAEVSKRVLAQKIMVERKNTTKDYTLLCSRSTTISVGKDFLPVMIGERINPTGRKKLAQELKEKKFLLLNQEARLQKDAGADLLDINVSHPEVLNPVLVMEKAVLSLNVDLPLSIDSPDSKVLEAGLKSFAGKALINSVSGEEKSLEQVLPLAKKYGAAIIGLTLDDDGIPKTVEKKIAIAKKILSRALQVGILRENIIIDPLVMAVGAKSEAGKETLEAVRRIREELNLSVSLGISNVSHGLPERSLLNRVYLSLAVSQGLNAAIVNPLDSEIKRSLVTSALLSGSSKALSEYLNLNQVVEKVPEKKTQNLDLIGRIYEVVLAGEKEQILNLITESLKTEKPQDVMNKALLTAMEEVGKRFKSGEYFLPQVMASAETMKQAFERIKGRLKTEEVKSLGRVVIATVKGDVHDIGKNIVVMMLENHGFEVLDLGKNVETEKIMKAVKEYHPRAVLLSALLTTTISQMEIVNTELKKLEHKIPLVIGGAVVTPGYAKKIGAYYAADAIEGIALLKRILT